MSTMRRVVVTAGSLAVLVGVGVDLLEGPIDPFKTMVRLLATSALVGLAFDEWIAGARMKSALAIVFTGALCLLVPFTLDGQDMLTSLLALLIVPLTLTLLYVDEPGVVLGASLAGAVSVLLARDRLSVPPAQYLMLLGAGVLVHGVAAFCSFALAKQRSLERDRELHRNQQDQLAERRQAQVERMALVGQLAAGVAHEINNPLAFVSSNVTLVREHLEGGHQLSGERPQDVLAEAQEGLARIRQIVSDLKAFAREDTDGNRPVNLADVVQEALRLAAVNMPPGVSVEVAGLASAPIVKSNHRKLVQVVLNLLVNAGDAIEQARVKNPAVRLVVRRTLRGLALDVHDNGGGVPKDVQDHLFEPFFTTKPPGKGTGLGLAMSRETLRSLGGDLLYAPSGAGACFTVELTALPPKTPPALPSLDRQLVSEA